MNSRCFFVLFFNTLFSSKAPTILTQSNLLSEKKEYYIIAVEFSGHGIYMFYVIYLFSPHNYNKTAYKNYDDYNYIYTCVYICSSILCSSEYLYYLFQ